MDNTKHLKVSSPPGHVASFEGIYTDFDGWLTRFNSSKKSTYLSQEISTTDAGNENNARRNSEDIFEKDFFDDIVLRERHIQRSAKPPSYNYKNENEGFVFYDHVFYGLVNKNGDRRIFCQNIRSKL